MGYLYYLFNVFLKLSLRSYAGTILSRVHQELRKHETTALQGLLQFSQRRRSHKHGVN